MNLNSKIASGIFLILIIFALCQGFIMQGIISSAGDTEIETLRKDEMDKARQQLKNYVELAYNIVEANYENSRDINWLEKTYSFDI